ncbi:MAG TPA: hypothetical protein VJ276_16715 [Thermoanaerobaculia bacterium]|nr:hypothetical protein [Thermoanaerobaculia bacterium]
MNPAATFDVLAIHNHLRRSLGSISRAELHLFAYLACLLSLYDRAPASEWRYSFVATEFGTPFSSELEAAFGDAILTGTVAPEGDEDLTALTSYGDEEFRDLSTLLTTKARDRFIEAACATALVVPLAVARSAINNDRRIKASESLQSSRALLTEDWFEDVHAQFDVLRAAVGDASIDLLAPAVVWLRYFGESDVA